MKNSCNTYPMYGFAERLDDAMYKKNMSCVKLADIVGMERKAIISYKNGYTTPDATVLAKICKTLNVSADYLLFGE